MSVEFNEPAITPSARASSMKKPSFLINTIIKTGIVKTEQGAQVVLMLIAAVLLILSYVMFTTANQPLPSPTPEQVAI